MKLPFNATLEQQENFQKFYEILIETNKQFNLTNITEEDEVAEKHFLDSIQVVGLIKENLSVVDVGAGAGFPSVPVKIMRPDLQMTLVDSLNKRVKFLEEIGKQLSFNNFECVHARAEDFAVKKRESFDVGLARAVASLPTLCELVAPFVKVGGKLLLHKGAIFEAEIAQSEQAFKELGLVLNKVERYKLQNAGQERVIIVLDKVRHTPLKYPRAQNKPRTNPL